MKINSRYDYNVKKDLLGKGGFARVFKARDTLLDRDVAIKVFNHQQNEKYSVLEEIRKVIQLEHPNLLRYYDVILLEQQNALGEQEQLQIGVMELANAGDLKTFAQKNPGSPVLFKLLRDVLEGLSFLHGKGIIHRDLKAQNVLLVDIHGELTAKISDFGISKHTESTGKSSTMAVGTIEYMAPEQFNPKKFGIGGKISTNVDLWSFGIMVHELLTDSTPFGSRDQDTTAEQIMSSILSTELPQDIEKLPEPYRSVIKRCLVSSAQERIRQASELLQYFGGQAAAISSEDDETRLYAKVPAAAEPSAEHEDATRVYAKANPESDETRRYEKTSAATHTAPRSGQRHYIKWAAAALLLVLTLGGYAKWQVDARLKVQEQARLVEQQTQQAEEHARQEATTIDPIIWDRVPPASAVGAPEEEETWAAKFGSQGLRYQSELCEKYYLFPYPVENDYRPAMQWCRKAAEHGDSKSQYLLGLLYYTGKGTSRDLSEALRWVQRAVDAGYRSDYSDVEDILKRIKLALSMSQAQSNTSLRIATQDKPTIEATKPHAEPKRTLTQAQATRQENNIEAIVKKAQQESGWGSDQNALNLYLKAADLGHIESQSLLCRSYYSWREYKQSMSWCKKAASQGDVSSQYYVGLHYYEESGVPKDINQALYWLQKAVNNGHDDAPGNLRKVKLELRID